MKAFIATSEALGYASEAIHALEAAYKDYLLDDNACAAYLDLIDARYKLEKALAAAQPTNPIEINDSDYNLRGF
jgi:hypothetical protein